MQLTPQQNNLIKEALLNFGSEEAIELSKKFIIIDDDISREKITNFLKKWRELGRPYSLEVYLSLIYLNNGIYNFSTTYEISRYFHNQFGFPGGFSISYASGITRAKKYGYIIRNGNMAKLTQSGFDYLKDFYSKMS